MKIYMLHQIQQTSDVQNKRMKIYHALVKYNKHQMYKTSEWKYTCFIKYNKHQMYKTREWKYICLSNTTNIRCTKQAMKIYMLHQIQQTSDVQNKRMKIYMLIKYNKHQMYKTGEWKYTCSSNTTNIRCTKQENENIYALSNTTNIRCTKQENEIYICLSNTTNIRCTKQENENIHAYQIQQTSDVQNKRMKIYMLIKYNKHQMYKTREWKYTCLSNTTNIRCTKQENENIHAHQIQQTSDVQNKRMKIYMLHQIQQTSDVQNRRMKIYMLIKYNKHQMYKTSEWKYICLSNTTNIRCKKQENENIHAHQIQQTSDVQNKRMKIYMLIKYNKHQMYKTREWKYTCSCQIQQTSDVQNKRMKIYMLIKYNKHQMYKTREW